MVAIDTVRAFHLSFGFLVEIDIVLPEEMTLREAHDIGEALQWKIEALPEVERAFVHLDYEVDHKPEHVTAHRPDWSHNSVSIEPASPDTSPSARPRRRLKTARTAAAAATATATVVASTASEVPVLDSAESEPTSRKNAK
jgi:hypothetical protein